MNTHGDVMNTETVLTMWVRSMRAAGRSPRTVAERVRVVRACGLDATTATVWDLEAWLAHDGWTPATRRAYRECLRAFFRWMHARGLRGDDPATDLEQVRVPRSSPHPVSTADLRRLLATARTRRLRGYLLLCSMQGLRVSEVAAVRGEDLRDGWLLVRGKGGTVARLPVHPDVAAYAAGMPAAGWWFPSRGGGHVTGNNVSRVVSDHMARQQVRGSAHWLRHWFGSELVAAGVQMRVVQEGMRHANLQATQVYTQVRPADLEAAVTALPRAA